MQILVSLYFSFLLETFLYRFLFGLDGSCTYIRGFLYVIAPNDIVIMTHMTRGG